MDSSSDMSYKKNQIQRINLVTLLKTGFLCNDSIRRNLYLKLQKVDKGDGTYHKRLKVRRHNIRVSSTSNIIYSELKNFHNQVFMINLIL